MVLSCSSSFFFSFTNNSKGLRRIGTICVPNDCSAIRDYSFFSRAECEITSASYKDALYLTKDFSTLLGCNCMRDNVCDIPYMLDTIGYMYSNLTPLTRKLRLIYGRCKYRMTPLLSEMSIFCVRAG